MIGINYNIFWKYFQSVNYFQFMMESWNFVKITKCDSLIGYFNGLINNWK